MSLAAKTDDGYEMQYQVKTKNLEYSNFLNDVAKLTFLHAHLPGEPSESILTHPGAATQETASSSGDGRILFVSSLGHTRSYGAVFNPENLNSEQGYDRMKTYSCTKLYNVSIWNQLI